MSKLVFFITSKLNPLHSTWTRSRGHIHVVEANGRYYLGSALAFANTASHVNGFLFSFLSFSANGSKDSLNVEASNSDSYPSHGSHGFPGL